MSDWNKYDKLFQDQPDARDIGKYGPDKEAELRAEEGLLIDGLTVDQYFARQDTVNKIVSAHRVYTFTKQKPCEVINIGGHDYQLKDYGLENTFSESVDITIPWLCICKGIKKIHIENEIRKENELSI